MEREAQGSAKVVLHVFLKSHSQSPALSMPSLRSSQAQNRSKSPKKPTSAENASHGKSEE